MSEITLLNQFLKDAKNIPLSELKDFFQKIEKLKEVIKQIEDKQKQTEQQKKEIDNMVNSIIEKVEAADDFLKDIKEDIEDSVNNFNTEKKKTIIEIKDWSNKYYKSEIDNFNNILSNTEQMIKKTNDQLKETNKNIADLNDVIEQNKREAKAYNNKLTKDTEHKLELLNNKLKRINAVAIIGLLLSLAIIIVSLIIITFIGINVWHN